MAQSIPSYTSTQPVSARRHSDPPGLWLAVIAGSLIVHLIVLVNMRLDAVRVTSPQEQADSVPIDLVDVSPETQPQASATQPTSPSIATEAAPTAVPEAASDDNSTSFGTDINQPSTSATVAPTAPEIPDAIQPTVLPTPPQVAQLPTVPQVAVTPSAAIAPTPVIPQPTTPSTPAIAPTPEEPAPLAQPLPSVQPTLPTLGSLPGSSNPVAEPAPEAEPTAEPTPASEPAPATEPPAEPSAPSGVPLPPPPTLNPEANLAVQPSVQPQAETPLPSAPSAPEQQEARSARVTVVGTESANGGRDEPDQKAEIVEGGEQVVELAYLPQVALNLEPDALVSIQVLVDKSGKPEPQAVMQGSKGADFDQWVMSLLQDREFKPAYQGGEPVDSLLKVSLRIERL